MARLDDADLSAKLPKDEYEPRLAAAQQRLLQLRLHCAGLTGDGQLGPPLCVMFEGWDASGKGGAIKRLLQELDVRHVRVVTYAAPTPDEKRHHFLHRFWPRCRAGAAWPCSTAAGTAGCSSSASRASPARTTGAAPTTRSSSSSGCSAPRG
jgi:polyphosphate kinase 2 (PPK2 family)